MMVVMLSLLLSLSFVSAAYSNDVFNHRYQGPSGKSSASYYKVNYGSGYYNQYGDYQYYTVNQARVPTFKGSYGNYRQVMYANGDWKPTQYFVNYPEYGYKPYFSGGSGNYYGGYGGYNSYGLGSYGGYGGGLFGIGTSRYLPSYSYNSYGNNYYPSYSYSYSGGCSYSYC